MKCPDCGEGMAATLEKRVTAVWRCKCGEVCSTVPDLPPAAKAAFAGCLRAMTMAGNALEVCDCYDDYGAKRPRRCDACAARAALAAARTLVAKAKGGER